MITILQTCISASNFWHWELIFEIMTIVASVRSTQLLKSHRNRQNSHFVAHILLLQRSLVVKLGVSPSRSRSLTLSHSLSSGDSTKSHRLQCWDEVSPHHNYQSTWRMFYLMKCFLSNNMTIQCRPEALPGIYSCHWIRRLYSLCSFRYARI
jgi:hypothetical protein